MKLSDIFKAASRQHVDKAMSTTESLLKVIDAVREVKNQEEPPGVTDYLKIGVTVVDSAMRIYDAWQPASQSCSDLSHVFTDMGWKRVLHPYAGVLEAVDFDTDSQSLKETRDFEGKLSAEARVKKFGSLQIGVARTTFDGNAGPGALTDNRGFYVSAADEQRVPAEISRLFQEMLQARAFTFRTHAETYDEPKGFSNLENVDHVIARVRRFVDVKEPRSILLVGEYGTGKTSAAYAIAKVLGLTFVSASAESAAGNVALAPTTRSERPTALTAFHEARSFIQVLRPGVVAINDLDSFNSDMQARVLDTAEVFKQSALVTVYTANDLRKISPAVLRVGRIDEVFDVRGVSKDDAARLLHGCVSDERIIDRVVGWPVAYVACLRSAIKALGPEAIDEEITRIEHRRSAVLSRAVESGLDFAHNAE